MFSKTSIAGVRVGSNGKLVSTLDGSNVVLMGNGVTGMMFGNASQTNVWDGIANVTPTQWAAYFSQWENTLTSAAKAVFTFTAMRLYLSSACWGGYTGIDPYNNSGSAAAFYRIVGTDANGRTLYSAGTSGGGAGTGVGNEVNGDYTTYRARVKTTIANILAGFALLGRNGTVIVDLQWGTPVWSVTGQKLMPVEQSALLSSVDALDFWPSAATDLGGDPRIVLELFNEIYGTNTSANWNNVEQAYIGNGNGNPNSTFLFPTLTTSPAGTNGGYLMNFGAGVMGGNQTCVSASQQQALNAIRAANFTGVVLAGCTAASQWLAAWSANGGQQIVVDPYSIGGIKQLGAAYHAYSNGATLAQLTALRNAGYPPVVTEYGAVTGSPASGNPPITGNSYTWMHSNISGYIACAVGNFDNVTNISNQGKLSLTGTNPWKNFNVPVGNGTYAAAGADSTDTSQIPTGFN